MAKSKLVGSDGNSLLDMHGNQVGESVPTLSGVSPCGSQILIEFLTAQELMNTSIIVSEKTEAKVPLQGYIRSVGPGVKLEDWGFKVGDRVLISGSGVMAPKYDNTPRDRFFMEPHAIKAVLIEAR